jgi:hypothetical protein
MDEEDVSFWDQQTEVRNDWLVGVFCLLVSDFSADFSLPHWFRGLWFAAAAVLVVRAAIMSRRK